VCVEGTLRAGVGFRGVVVVARNGGVTRQNKMPGVGNKQLEEGASERGRSIAAARAVEKWQQPAAWWSGGIDGLGGMGNEVASGVDKKIFLARRFDGRR